MNRLIREKHHRLPVEAYDGYVAVAFTANVRHRKNLFKDGTVCNVFQELLLKESRDHRCLVYVYLFMPDHLHCIIAGDSEESNVKMCMDMFKQQSGFWLYKNKPDFHWQKDYYDHIIRNEADMNNQVMYILNNPVRAGLVMSWKRYPYKGSTVFDFYKWEESMSPRSFTVEVGTACTRAGRRCGKNH